MNCDEVIRELAVPTEDRDSRALAEHLSDCATCADWARRADQLDRLWQLTRPADLSTEVWDSVWSRVTASLDAPATALAGETLMSSGHGQNGVAAKPDGVRPGLSACAGHGERPRLCWWGLLKQPQFCWR